MPVLRPNRKMAIAIGQRRRRPKLDVSLPTARLAARREIQFYVQGGDSTTSGTHTHAHARYGIQTDEQRTGARVTYDFFNPLVFCVEATRK